MAKSPTARSLELLREMNFDAQVVEYFHGPSKKRRDLFGCIDIIAAHPTLGILGVQATSSSNHSARFKKACRAPIRKWLEGGARMQIQSWGLKGKAGQKKRWTVRVQQVTLKDLVDEALLSG
jgi:hypothetical protein